MKRIRTVMQVGNSIAVTIPQEIGFELGDEVLLTKKDDTVVISKLKIPS